MDLTDKIYIDNAQMHKHVQNILSQIQRDNWLPEYVVGITRGGLHPAVLISHYLDVPMNALKVSLRDKAECETNCWMAEDAFGWDAEPKNILVVDDINDSGATISWIKKDWTSSCMPNDARWATVWGNNVRFATVVNNLASSEEVSYSSLEINKTEDPCWVVFPVEDWWK